MESDTVPEYLRNNLGSLAYDLMKSVYTTNPNDCKFGRLVGVKHSNIIYDIIGWAMVKRDIEYLKWLVSVTECGITYNMLYKLGGGKWTPCFDACACCFKSPMVIDEKHEDAQELIEHLKSLGSFGIEVIGLHT